MKSPTLSALFTLALTFSTLPAIAGSSVSFVSNLPENAASVAADKTTWIAQSFAVPTTSAVPFYTLEEIQVALQKAGSGAAATYLFRLYGNNTGVTPSVPLKPLGSMSLAGFTAPGFLASNAAFNFVLTAGPRLYLVPGKTYWIVLTSTNVSTANYLGWNTTSNAAAGIGTLGSSVMTSADKGVTWTVANTGNPMALDIDVLTR